MQYTFRIARHMHAPRIFKNLTVEPCTAPLVARTKAKPLLELQVRLRATVSRKFNQWLAS